MPVAVARGGTEEGLPDSVAAGAVGGSSTAGAGAIEGAGAASSGEPVELAVSGALLAAKSAGGVGDAMGVRGGTRISSWKLAGGPLPASPFVREVKRTAAIGAPSTKAASSRHVRTARASITCSFKLRRDGGRSYEGVTQHYRVVPDPTSMGALRFFRFCNCFVTWVLLRPKA